MITQMIQVKNRSAYVSGGIPLDEDELTPDLQNLVPRCCGFLPGNRHWNFSHVFSPFARLYYNFSGGHYIVHDGRVTALGPGRFVLVPENVLFHCVSPEGAPGHLYVHFNLSTVRPSLLQAPVAVKADRLSISCAHELVRGIKKSPPSRLRHLASALVHRVLGRIPGNRPIIRVPSETIQKAIVFAGNNLAADLSNTRLAQLAGMSLRGFLRVFVEEMGISPQSYIREIRLKEAARRLASGTDSIDEISHSLGFPNRYYFTRRFTAQMDSSPGVFRKKFAIKKRVAGARPLFPK